jgi:hypothetical protein
MTQSLILTPKGLFKQQKDQVANFRAIARHTHFQLALSAALAELAQSHKPTSEELNGARKFINVLLNLAEGDPSPSRFPVKTLDHSVLEPPKETPANSP